MLTRAVYNDQQEMKSDNLGYWYLRRKFNRICNRANIEPGEQLYAVEKLLKKKLLVPVLEEWFEARGIKSAP